MADTEPAKPANDGEEVIHICGVTEAMLANLAAWRKRRLRWQVAGNLPNLTRDVVRSVFQQAFDSWQSVCGLSFEEGTPADILVTTGRIDGTFKVLAWSELPDGSDRSLTQKYDTSESWIVSEAPPQNRIDLVAVAAHEIGHALGLDHARPGTRDLMEPTYAPGRRVPQPGDISRIVSLYGPPVAPPPPDGVDLPAEIWIIGRSGAVTAKFKLDRIQ